jgi:hypothetical protein
MEKNELIGTLTPRPSMIRRKLEYTEKIDPDAVGLVKMHSTDRLSFAYDIENGEAKVILDANRLEGSIQELREWMEENKIPVIHEGSSTFFIDAINLRISDITTLEANGFQKAEEGLTTWEMIGGPNEFPVEEDDDFLYLEQRLESLKLFPKEVQNKILRDELNEAFGLES